MCCPSDGLEPNNVHHYPRNPFTYPYYPCFYYKRVRRVWALSRATSNVGKVELLPTGEQSDQEGETNKGDGHGENGVQAVHITVENNGVCLVIKRLTKSSSASKNQLALVNLRSVLGDVEEHLVDKSSLATRDDVGTTKTLEDCKLSVI